MSIMIYEISNSRCCGKAVPKTANELRYEMKSSGRVENKQDYFDGFLAKIKDEMGEVEEVSSESTTMEVGDYVIGSYLGQTETTDHEDKPITVVNLSTKTGRKSIRLSKYLESMMENIEKGQRIAVVCVDVDTTRAGREFKVYRVYRAVDKDK